MTRAKMMFKCQPKQSARNVYQMYIYDNICKRKIDWSTWEVLESETSAKYFQKVLADIPANATIELYINSQGGDAIEGTAIYNQLVRHPAQKTGYVDGVAYSAAFLILMACNHIVMGLGTTALCHNMWLETAGNATELRKAADDLDKLMESNRKIFLQRCNMSEEELKNLMEEERILTPEECLAYGFCDEVSQQQAAGTDEPPEDNPPEDNPPEDDPPEDDPPEDDPEEGSTNQKKQFQTYLDKRRDMLRQLSQLEEIAGRGSYPDKPVQNKCINFFDNF